MGKFVRNLLVGLCLLAGSQAFSQVHVPANEIKKGVFILYSSNWDTCVVMTPAEIEANKEYYKTVYKDTVFYTKENDKIYKQKGVIEETIYKIDMYKYTSSRHFFKDGLYMLPRTDKKFYIKKYAETYHERR